MIIEIKKEDSVIKSDDTISHHHNYNKDIRVNMGKEERDELYEQSHHQK